MTSPWLYSRAADLAFILAPAFLVTALVELLPAHALEASVKAEAWAWLLLVVGVDVAHVYSTLWRTYLDREEANRYRSLLIAIPVACWLIGVILYSLGGALAFWRVLAYVAVFHFVRQQYGFLRLYSRKEPPGALGRHIDAIAIYGATVYPMIYWHAHGRSFQWFVKDDFFPRVISAGVERAAFAVWALALTTFFVKELRRGREANAPKILLLLGTALSWYCGIVRHDGDLAFTATNVVAHGVPYMALVWMYQRKRRPSASWFRPSHIPVFVGLLLVLAYFEEGIWDALVWRDHAIFYGWLSSWIPKLEDPSLLSLAVPLLALPQATHYVLDGFIWKVRDVSAGGALGGGSRS